MCLEISLLLVFPIYYTTFCLCEYSNKFKSEKYVPSLFHVDEEGLFLNKLDRKHLVLTNEVFLNS